MPAIFKIAELAVEVSSVTPVFAEDRVMTFPPVPSVAVKREWALARPSVVVIVAEPDVDNPGKTVLKNLGAVAA